MKKKDANFFNFFLKNSDGHDSYPVDFNSAYTYGFRDKESALEHLLINGLVGEDYIVGRPDHKKKENMIKMSVYCFLTLFISDEDLSNGFSSMCELYTLKKSPMVQYLFFSIN